MKHRSNMFSNIESKFKNATKQEIINTALDSSIDFIEAVPAIENTAKYQAMVVLTRLGVYGDGIISLHEEKLIDLVFGPLWIGPKEELYEMIAIPIEEADYKLVELFMGLSKKAAIPMLQFILSFAYIDGVIEDDVAERLDSLFGMSLLDSFVQSGHEEVPVTTAVTSLEDDIVSWFSKDNAMHKLSDIQSQFSERSHDEIQEALDSLVDKGILIGGPNIVGNMYFLA